jgi:DNA-binding CsgD family transcriptional regulator
MQFFTDECPQIGGARTRKAYVDAIVTITNSYYLDKNHLKQGQISWTAVHKDSKGAYGKKIQETALTPVTLTLVQDSDALDRALGTKLRDIKKEAVARLCNEAYKQNGCMSLADISILLKIAPATASKYILEYEKENSVVLPRRGTIHDMGPTVTHKEIIIEKLFIEQKTVQQVMRETNHSSKAIERYITAFKRVLLCVRKGMNRDEIAYSLSINKKVIDQYLKIIETYKEKKYILDKLENFEVNEETAFESLVYSMTH